MAYDIPENLAAADREAARLGSNRGREHAHQEVQDVMRQNRDIGRRNFAERELIVESATPRGLLQNYKEETGLVQTSATLPELPPSHAVERMPPPREPEYFTGTYGKEYQIGTYQTNEYETADYATTPYKSVYEP